MHKNALEMLTQCVLICMLFVMLYEIMPVINMDKLKFKNNHSGMRTFLFYRAGKKRVVCNLEIQ